MDLKQCIDIMRVEVKDKFALAYIDALNEVIDVDGMHGLIIQMKYIKENIKNWRGGHAKEVKAFITKWLKEKDLDIKK